MRLHVIRALASLAFLSVTTAAVPTSDDTTAARSDLLSREVACVPSAEQVTCWNDGYGLVPVGSFSFIMAAGSPCQVQLLTQNFPYNGRLYPLKDGATTGCDSNLGAVLLITESDFCGSGGDLSTGDLAQYGADEPIDLGDVDSSGVPNDSRCSSVTDDDRIRCIMVA